jgi:hypothetical protein
VIVDGDADPTTEELRLDQLNRERVLRDEADRIPADDDTGEQVAARADKAQYLREKLEERAEAERGASD